MNWTKNLRNVIKNKKGTFVLEIGRAKHIEKFEIEEVLIHLNLMLIKPKSFFNKLVLSINGYDNDPRELRDIEEVRTYLTFLDKCFPYWFFFSKVNVPNNLKTPQLILMCTCDFQKKGSYIEFDENDYSNFFNNHFLFMNEIMEKEKYTEGEIRARSEQIFNSFN